MPHSKPAATSRTSSLKRLRLAIVVSLIAEQLKISAATQILDARGLEDAHAVGGLPAADQRAVVLAIMRREIGAMTLSALVVTVLLARAATVIH